MHVTGAGTIIWSILRLGVAVAIAAAIVGQLVRSISISAERGWPITQTVVDFFSFFTILSNATSMVVLVIGAVLLLRPGTVDSRVFATVLVSVTTYMLITGIVYNVLLRGIPLPQGSTVPWSNEILHVWAPLFFVLDLLLAPRRRALPWTTIGTIAAFPIVWLAYTLVRGPFTLDFRTGNAWWYPYPFLNPHVQPWGYGGVALYSIGIAVAILGFGAIAIGVGRLRARRGAVAGGSGVSGAGIRPE
jgi:hypothetical protein